MKTIHWFLCLCAAACCQLSRADTILVQDEFNGAAGSPPNPAELQYAGPVDWNGTGVLNLNMIGIGSAWMGAGPSASTYEKAITGFRLTTGNIGNLINNPEWVTGRYGNALSLSNGQYVTVPAPSPDLFNITGDLTLALWIKPNSVNCAGADPAYALISKRSINHATPYELYITNGGGLILHYFGTNVDYPTFTASGTVVAGVWQHVAVTRSFSGSNATVTFYINGIQAGSSTTATGPAMGSTDPVWISRDGYHTGYTNEGSYSGLMDEVQIYNRALSEAEIARIYSNDDACMVGRVGNWKFDETSGSTVSDTLAVGIIQEQLKTITATVPEGTNVTALTPLIEISPNTAVFPLSGSVQNFSRPVPYTVTAEDGSTVTYTVGVTSGATLDAHFSSIISIPVTVGSYTATGRNVNFSLGFAPPVGTNLMVVKNTGLPFISGQFSNLTHGQIVELPFGGTTYRFVANYYGGNGNDLVLEWPYRQVVAWGSNGFGQLGNGTNASSNVPVNVTQTGALAGKTVIAIAGGGDHNLALCSDGTVAAWGCNTYGQLGDGTFADRGIPVPVERSGVLNGKSVIAISAGGSHSLALCSDGTIAAWGGNWSGQLGDGTNTDSSLPVAVNQSGVLSGKNIAIISSGAAHNLVLCSDGTLVTWGDNEAGQLGDGTMISRNVPVNVYQTGILLGKSVVGICCGSYHALLLCSDGNLLYMGNGTLGYPGQIVPGVLLGKTIVALSCGGHHNAVICSDGTLATWGDNSSGQLGNGTFVSNYYPGAINEIGILIGKTVNAIASGAFHSMALCSDSTLATWGENFYGQLGDGTNTNSNLPLAVSQSSVLAGKTVISVACGNFHSLALTSLAPPAVLSSLIPITGTLSPAFSSGTKSYILSVPHTTSSITFTPTAGESTDTIKVNGMTVASTAASLAIPLSPGENIITIDVSNSSTTTYTVVVTRDATLEAAFATATTIPLTTPSYTATGSSVNLSLGFAPPVGTNLMVVNNTGLTFISGQFSNLAHGQIVDLPFGGKTHCFVANYFGGSGNDLVLEWPYRQVAAWGNNAYGQLGNGTNADSSVPAGLNQSGVLAGKTVVAVTGGYYHSLAMCSDGKMAGWGDNQYGQLGNGTNTNSHVPTEVNQSGVFAGKTVVAIAGGYYHSLAVCSDGTLAAWGRNQYGQLGNGTNTNSNVPVGVNQSGVLAGKTVLSVAGGYYHSLALCSDGTLAAWGDNQNGQLGDGSNTSSSVPVAVTQSGVLAGKSVIAISAGSYFNLVLCSDGTIAAWGYNYFGQLGNGTTTSSNVPVAVTQTGVLAGKAVVAVSGGGVNSMALCSDGTLAIWGDNGWGELGNGYSNPSSTPVDITQSGVLAGKTVVAVAGLMRRSFALCSNGTLAGWGWNPYGQLGLGTTAYSKVPADISQSGMLAGKSVVLVSGGAWHSLALAAYAPSSGLSSLTSSAGTLSPAFDPSTTGYTLTVPQGTTSITLTPTAAAPGTTITVNGSPVESGAASAEISLPSLPTAVAIEVTAADGTTRTYTVNVNNAMTGTMEGWMAGKFTTEQLADPAISGALATPANDGITNLMKYALAIEPMACGLDKLPFSGEQDGYLTLTFRRNKSATDIGFSVEAGSDLNGWNPAGSEISRADGGDCWIVTVQDTVPIHNSSQRFMRLRVSRE